MGGTCVGIDQYPNASIAEYGRVSGEDVREFVFACRFVLSTLLMLPLLAVSTPENDG